MPRKLATRLILFLTVLVVIVGATSGFLQIKTQEQQMLATIITGADQLSNGITSATWHAMLSDNREVAYQIMHTIALRQGIDMIRIFNREGRIMFSTVPADSGRVERDAQVCAVCHSTPVPRVDLDPLARARVFTNAQGKRELAMVTPIYNEQSCSTADCHAHPASVKVLGVLDVTYSLEGVDNVVVSMQRRNAAMTMVSVVLIGVFIFFFVRSTVHRPIARLIDGTRAISAMQLDQPIEVRSNNEIGELADSFNIMRERLRQAVAELNELTQGLEQKVQQRTDQLKAINQKLFQSDRLASLGQLAASVAHEINNPIAGVLNLSMLLQRIIDERGIPPHRIPEVRGYLDNIVKETTRVGRIVTDLLAFSRRSSPHRGQANLNTIIHHTVSIIDHKMKLTGTDLELLLDPNLPEIPCDGSQIQQVVINLVMNAAEATQAKGNGRVRVRTSPLPDKKGIRMEVTDNGDGIPKEHLGKIFDPFFTTKEEGKGVGLGLAVVYGIIDAHGGDVEVVTEHGKGTTFIVDFPLETVPPVSRHGTAGTPG